MKKFVCSMSEPVVRTKAGSIRGFYFDGVYNFWGIRYATANRFEQPEPVTPWEGIRDALAYGMVCPLLEEPAPAEEIGVPHRFWPASEDCLNLCIWTPSVSDSSRLPVMVWFHGGGYFAGSCIEHIAYEGDELARKYNVVVVGINHRLNVFGHLDVSAFGDKFKNSCNAGIADLVASLEWVKTNIAGFGGDPENVTIFGQSGGGGKVTTLGQTPAADGLFQKAIVMSGVFARGGSLDIESPDPKKFVLDIMKELNIKDESIEKLQKVPCKLLIMAVNRVVNNYAKLGIFVNWEPKANDWYAGNPLMCGFREHFKEIPTMVGSTITEFNGWDPQLVSDRNKMNEEEQKLVVYAKYGRKIGDEIISRYKKAYPGKNLAYAAYIDFCVRPASIEYCKQKAKGAAPVYCYMFSSIFDYANGKSAWHCADIPFFFHNALKIPYTYSTENQEALNELMSESFVNFARTGNPNSGDVKGWNPVTPESCETMVFDTESACKADFDQDLIDYITSVPQDGFFI